jgi:hypothetical protein
LGVCFLIKTPAPPKFHSILKTFFNKNHNKLTISKIKMNCDVSRLCSLPF